MLLPLETGLLESALAAPVPQEDCSTQTLIYTTMTTDTQIANDFCAQQRAQCFSGEAEQYEHSEMTLSPPLCAAEPAQEYEV